QKKAAVIDLPAALQPPRTADEVDPAELLLPIGIWFLAVQIVARNFAKPDRVIEIEACADFLQPFEERVLLGGLFFQDGELVVSLRQRLEQLTAQRICR